MSSFINFNNKTVSEEQKYTAEAIKIALLKSETKSSIKAESLTKNVAEPVSLNEALTFFTDKLKAVKSLSAAIVEINEGRVKQFESDYAAMVKDIKSGYGWIDPEYVAQTWDNSSDSIDFELVRDEIFDRLIAAGLLAHADANNPEKAGKKIKSAKELYVLESAIISESATKQLADEEKFELYDAELTGKSVTLSVTSTTKTWDDGVPVLKYLARGSAKPTSIQINGSFEVAHDVARGWFYFTDGRKWYALHQEDGYNDPSDLPFKMTVKESKVEEASFFRLPKDVVGNDLYMVSKNLTNLYDSVNAGNDVDPGVIDSVIRGLNKIKKAVKKFDNAEDIKGSVYELEVNEDWGSSDQAAMNKSIHRDAGSPKTMPSPFDPKLRAAAEDAVDFYWDDWEEYQDDRDALIDNAVRSYLRSYFKDQFALLVRMFEGNEINENYEVIFSDGISQMKKFRSEAQAIDFMKKEIASNKKLRDIAVYKPGMHSTTQTELVVSFWGNGSYLDNVSKKDPKLAAKKLEESVEEAKMPEPRKDEYYFLVRNSDAKDIWKMADDEFGNHIDRGRIEVLFQKNKYVIKDFELAKRFYQYLRDRGVKFFDQNFVSESVDEAYIGPFVFNDRMSDEELKAMYNDALNGYANWQKGFEYPKSDYKKAYQEIEKILKKRGVSVDESIVTEGRSINKIQKDWNQTTTDMQAKVAQWKEAEGDRKSELLDELKALTAKKKALEAELEDAVAGKDKDVQLAVSEGNAFLAARAKALEEDAEEFEFNGKTYPVIKEGNAFGAARAEAIAKDEEEFEVDGEKFPVKSVDKEDEENAEEFVEETVEITLDSLVEKFAMTNEDLRTDVKKFIKENNKELNMLADNDQWDLMYQKLYSEFGVEPDSAKAKDLLKTFQFVF